MILTRARAPESCARGAPQRLLRSIGTLVLGLAAGNTFAADSPAGAIVSYHIVGDGIPEPLAVGDAARGKALVAARDPANCVLCHAVPDAAIPFAGNVGPSLAGVGARLSVPQLRLRVADNLRVNPQTIMPSYYRLADLNLVAAAYQGKTILTAPQLEDVVAYLATLR
jgi:sulfur-oxidizing protein SoxX